MIIVRCDISLSDVVFVFVYNVMLVSIEETHLPSDVILVFDFV